MSYKRLGGKKRTLVTPVMPLSKFHRFVIPTMNEALRLARRPLFKGYSERDDDRLNFIGDGPVDGNPNRLAQQMQASEALIDEAIALDPRLARKAQWLRRDEGEYCDSALLAQGDDAPFYKRMRSTLTDNAGSGEPVCVVISTDDRNIVADTAAAFIATARIVQQFVPLEIWWQGAWLSDDRFKGFAVFAPLCSGDMDFARLDYCLADESRDSFSFLCMATHAVYNAKEDYSGCGTRADWSYLPDRDNAKFVPHTGIRPTASSVAAQAVRWLGWESVWSVEYEQAQDAKAALQELPELPSESKPYEATEADRKRWREQEEAMRKKQQEDARRRLDAAQC